LILRPALIIQARFRIATGNDRTRCRGFTAWTRIQVWNAIACSVADLRACQHHQKHSAYY
jgi:hypothetical protein